MTQRKPLNKDKKLSTRQNRVIKAKVKADLAGISQAQVALEVFPNQTPAAASVSFTRTLKEANVQEELAKAFAQHGIDIDSAVKPIGEALKADRVVIVGKGDDAFADVQPDHSVRLKASGMALGLMGFGSKQSGEVTINFINHSNEQRGKYGI